MGINNMVCSDAIIASQLSQYLDSRKDLVWITDQQMEQVKFSSGQWHIFLIDEELSIIWQES
jgi:hypothetical protein